MTGWENQQTGDAGQSIVQAELATHGFLIGPLQPDPGEDFWVEHQGRRAISEGSFPLRALLQVKGTAKGEGAVFVDDLPIKQIVRWAAQPLPVFLVGVTTEPPATFYAKPVDAIVAEDLQGRDPTTMTGKTVRVRLPLATDLGALLADAILEHHRSMRMVLDGLSETDIEQHYFEVLERKKPEAWARASIASWKVLWKSAPRPQHFGAMLTELVRRVKTEYEGPPRPAAVVFHVYRSLYDAQHNLPVARVRWVDRTHPKADWHAAVLGVVGEFKIQHDQGVPETRSFLRERTASAEEFAAYAAKVGIAFDQITDAIFAGPGGVQVWTSDLRKRFKEADDLWNEGPFPPVQHKALHDALTAYFDALFSHEFVAIYRSRELSPDVVARLLKDSEARLRDSRGAWRAVLRRF